VKILEKLLKPIIIILFLGMTLVTLSSTIFRLFPFMPSLYWAGELTRYLNFWVICLCVGIAIFRGTHFTFDIILRFIPEKLSFSVIMLRQLCMVTLELVLIYYGVKFFTSNFDQLSAAMEVPMGYIYIGVPICGLIMLLATMQEIFKTIIENRKGVSTQ
jgi:TRAP-type C4-dicarboxylate transport system permease small subunit